MHFTRILLSIVFILSASTALAKKPDKILVCHVGNELGSMDETYQDNPDCTIPPEWVGDPADYICPDAGKIDLILVSTKAKHIGNPSHSFDDTVYLWEDYAPEDGIGNDPADFEEGDVVGIDRGCEKPEENLMCDCWSAYTQTELVSILNGIDPTIGPSTHYSCYQFIDRVQIESQVFPLNVTINATFNSGFDGSSRCFVSAWNDSVPLPTIEVNSPNLDTPVCYDELVAILPQITWCPDS